MASPPDRKRVPLRGISSRAYEHPADRGALVALRKLAGFDTVLRRISGLFTERSLRLIHLASAVRVGDSQFRDVNDYVRDAAHTLDLPEVPELYVVQDPMASMMTIGTDRPFIVMSTGAFELLEPYELRFAIGHEVGHVLSGHAVYRTLLLALTRLAARVAWIPLGYVGLRAIVTALEEWYRKSELSCDRAGLLACQDPYAARRALMKLAGGSRLAQMNTSAFLAQAREYNAAGDARDGVLKLLNLVGRTHPFAVIRLAELDQWERSGLYERILGGDYPRRSDDKNASASEEVRNAARSYQEAWKRSDDPLIDLARSAMSGAVQAGGRFADSVFNRNRADE